jgi:hypothetical protein
MTCQLTDARRLQTAFEALLVANALIKELKYNTLKISRVCCAKNVFTEHGAVPEMKEGPSEPACRSRLQTAVSCFSPKGCGGERYGQKA